TASRPLSCKYSDMFYSNPSWFIFFSECSNLSDVIRCRSAASAHQVYHPFAQIFFKLRGGFIGSLIILTELVRQSGIRIHTDEVRRLLVEHLKIWSQCSGAHRAVEANA